MFYRYGLVLRGPPETLHRAECILFEQPVVSAATAELLRKQEELEKKARELERRERELESHSLGPGACKSKGRRE